MQLIDKYLVNSCQLASVNYTTAQNSDGAIGDGMKIFRVWLVIDYYCIALVLFRIKYVGGSGDQYALMERRERLRKRKHGGSFTAGSYKTYQLRQA